MDPDFLFQIATTTLAVLLSSLFTLLTTMTNRKRERKLENVESNIIMTVSETENKNNSESILKAIEGIPQGLSPDEYFARLKKELLKLQYIQLKNPIDNNEKISSLLESYHQQALSQSSIQFWFSLISAIVGFLFIIFVIGYMILKNDSSKIEWYDYILRSLPGAIIEVVSVLFFNQARETRDRATNFFRELNYQKQIANSVSIADTIDDSMTKSNIKAKIALHIIGIKDDSIEIQSEKE